MLFKALMGVVILLAQDAPAPRIEALVAEWRRVEEAQATVCFKCSKRVLRDEQTIREAFSLRVQRDKTGMLCEYEQASPALQSVYGFNSKYFFRVAKQDGRWKATEVRSYPDISLVSSILNQLPRSDRAYEIEAIRAVALGNESLATMAGRRFFQVQNLHMLPNGRLRLEFAYVHEPKENLNAIQKAICMLDPGHQFVLLEADVVLGHQNSSARHLEFSYRQKGDNLVLRSITETDPAMPQIKHVTEYEQLEPPSLDPAKSPFTLTAFGLTEPPGADWPRPTPWWLYAPIAGVTLILAGVLVRRFAGRRAAA